ncbi:MAG TPA: putative zinc-binding peptidase [Chryseolinea sp.]
MKLFKCQHCGQLLYFENTYCERCGHVLGFWPETMELLTLVKTDEQTFADVLRTSDRYQYCANAQHGACNWLVRAGAETEFCRACRLNNTIPDLNNPERLEAWKKIEIAKHRLIYTLLKLGLAVPEKTHDSSEGLAFDFLAENGSQDRVVMGHAQGLITINLAEADEVKRIRTREQLGEPYRTLLGHFRHEVGHYYWDALVKIDENRIEEFRSVFGNEEADYQNALQLYYQNGPVQNWQNDFVSAYATAHPWEDWAETWAHYLHVMDTLETAYSFGLRINPVAVSKVEMLLAEFGLDPFKVKNFQRLIDLWIPLTIALNSINRSMGQPDLYPFVVSPAVVRKLNFVHTLLADVKNINLPLTVWE